MLLRYSGLILALLLTACGGGGGAGGNDQTDGAGSFTSESLLIHSSQADDDYPLTILLPPDHDPAQPLPLVLVLDGRWHQQRVADEVAATGTAAIVVGIGNDEVRDRDFIPPEFNDPWGLPPGAADRYFDMIRYELLPTLEAAYAIDTERRYIVGHSLGGLFVGYALMSDDADAPTFRGYFSSDASNFDTAYLSGLEDELASRTTTLPAELFCAAADRGNSHYARYSAERLQARGYQGLRLQISNYNETHDSLMPQAVPDAMRWFFSQP